MKKSTLPAVTKQPPKARSESIQLSMFSSFITNDESSVSNTIEIWESIPKYFLNSKQMEKLRNDDGLSKPYVWQYSCFAPNGEKLERTVTLQPALLKQDDGKYKAFFPSVTEELVEEALKKIFTEQNMGLHEVDKAESWVRFSLRMVYRELKNRGRTRDLSQIKQAIEIMTSCNITVEENGAVLYRGNILSDLVAVDRRSYEHDSSAHWIVRLPVFISHAINTLKYRQFNYARYMECNEQLARWLYKRLISRFRQASLSTEYNILFSEIQNSSGLLQTTPQTARRKVVSALDELVQRGVIIPSYQVSDKKDGRKIIDTKYVLHPSVAFINEQKAANKRQRDDAQVVSQIEKCTN